MNNLKFINKLKFKLNSKNLNKKTGNLDKLRAFIFIILISNLSFSQLALENFNSGIPSGWAVTSNLTVANNWSPTASGYQATGGAFVNPALNNTVGSTAEYYMISPQFLTPSNGEIRFFNRQGSVINRGATYQVRISTANQPDISSFNVVLGTWTEAQLSVIGTTYTENMVSLGAIPSGIPVYIAFVAITNQVGTTATNGDSWFVDNVRVIPQCTPVAGITTTLTAGSAIINWTHPTATEFSFQLVPTGVGIGTTGTPISGFTYSALGLDANTTYDFWIRANCDPTTSSGWAGPFTFTTPQEGLSCANPIIIPSDVSTTPYVLNSNLAEYYTETDYTNYTTVGSNCFPTGTSNYLLGNHLFFNYTPTTTGLIDIRQDITVISGGGPDACYNGLTSVMVYNSCADVGVSCLAAIKTGTSNFESLTGQISNFYVEAGNTYVIVMSSPYQHSSTNNASICFNFTVSGSACPAPAPSGTTYNNLTQTSADFSWGNVGNLVSAWEYVVLPVTSGAPTGTTVLTSTSNNLTNSVSSLSPATNYNLYVRSVCNVIPGPWASPLPFTTPCNVLPLPYYTGFTDTTASECWSQLNLNNDLTFFTFGNNAFSEPVAKIRAQNSNDMLVSPQFNFDGVTQKRLRFKYNVYGNWGLIVDNPTGGPGSFEIRLSTSGVGPNNFTTVVVPLAEYTTAYNFIEMMVPLPNVVGDINIAWVLPEGATQTGNWIYIDDVYIEDLPACSEPSYPVVTAGSITTTSATISWANGYNNSQWELVAQPLGTGIPTTPGIIVDTNPYTLTNLEPSTRYEFYMRAYCSSTEQSIWVGPINFNTLCIDQNTPYYESLDNTDVNTKKFCWSVINNSDELSRWRIEATEAQIRAASTMFQPFVNFDDWLVSAPINAVGLKRLRFNHRAVNGIFNPTPRGNVEVLMSSTPDFATYSVIIPSFDFTNIAYEEKSVLFTGTGTTYIAFRVPPTMSDPTNSGIMMIDDVYIDDAPPCPDPTNLTVSAVTTTTANFAWVQGYNETQWQVVVQNAGDGVPTGIGTTVDTTPVYNALSLTPNTLYEYYVRAICGVNGNGSWIGPITFRTDCNPLTTPFLETFDSTSTTETCWKNVNGNNDSNEWNLNQTVEPIFGNQMAALFTGTNGNNNDWLISPTLTVQPNQRLRFYFKVYQQDFEEDLKVMLSTNGSSINQFTTVLYENSLNSYTDANGVTVGSNTITLDSAQDVRVGDFIYIPGFPFPYPTYVAAINGTQITMTNTATITQTGIQNVQFEHEILNNEEPREFVINLTDITAPTNINLAFHTPYFDPNPWNYRGQYSFIDNVIIEDIPACPSVINVTTNNLVDTSVQLDWEAAGTEATWEISVQPYGTPAPVGATQPQYLHTTPTHPYTVNGLTPATQYQFYIKAICSGTSQSEWIGPFEFTTRCDYTNLCEYTITTISGNTGQVTQSVNVMQNGVVTQELEFPGFNQTPIDYTVFLCSGVAFDLYWDGLGSGVQYSEAQIIVKDATNTVIWTSPLGLGTVNTNIYSGFATCGPITCPEPTNLTVNNQGVLSWTPGATESQWEVFVQPVGNGTLPQSGTLVSSTTYTPIATDFVDVSASTYEYFVRAVCSSSNKSYWSGPKIFVRNDEENTSVHLPVNTGTTCDVSGVDVSFIGATPSTTPTACDGTNGGDVWFDFVATSKIHTIELSDFSPGSYYTSSYEGPWPKIIMSLYEVQSGGALVEKGCSDNNSFTAIYSSELVVGQTYKIRLKLNEVLPSNKKFHICITTPTDICDTDAFNYDFEKLPMQNVTGIVTIIDAKVVPGWRVNTDRGQVFYQEASNSLNVTPYSGGQCLQLIQDDAADWNPSDPNIKGLYKDFDTSQIPALDYSFASATRTSSSTVQLFAGPPSGPFTLVVEDTATSLVWELIEGTYTIPSGQSTTRFIFRTKNYLIGHLLDAANFKVNTDIVTSNSTLSCEDTSINVQANGVGEWVSSPSNPSTTIIASPTSNSTAISGFSVAGDYVYTWKTRYCEKSITVTYQAITETPSVTNLNYCLNEVASPLTASVSPGFITKWYADSSGGTGDVDAPTPDTSSIGTTLYYVAAINVAGCEGPRVPISVQVISLPTATITGATTICTGNTATISFSGTPNSEVTFTENSGANQTLPLDNDGLATFTTPVLTDTTTYTLVNVEVIGSTTCEQALNQNVLVTVTPLAAQDVVFSYNDVCILSTTSPIPITGTNFATGGTFASSTLNVNASTGEINMATATAGQHEITYTLSSNNIACTAGGSHTATINITATATQDLSFSYENVCIAASNPLPILPATFTNGGTFASSTLDVNATTGEINLATATAGDHQITYTLPSNITTCIAGGTNSATITINPSIIQEVSFSYATTCILSSTNPSAVLATNFATGGIFSSTTLDVNAATGEINLATATAGEHQVTYTLASNIAACTSGGTHIATINITTETTPNVTFAYATTCILSTTNPLPTLTTNFATGGTFSSTTLDVNATTGEINLVTATAGDHQVTYSIASDNVNCTSAGTLSITITITAITNSDVVFSYNSTCVIATSNPLPVVSGTFTTGGIFASATLSVNASTGEINLSTATAGDHQVTYTLPNNVTTCVAGGTNSTTITINPSITQEVSFSYATTCILSTTNPSAVLATNFVTGGTFSSTTLDVNATTGEINLATATAGDHQVTYTLAPNSVACTSGGTHVATISITTATTPIVSFSYATTCISSTTNPSAVLVTNFATGGTFSSTTLDVNSTTGEVNLATATAGNHQVTYILPSNVATCTLGGTHIATINITAETTPNVTFAYSTTCILSTTNPLPTLGTNFNTGGTFSSTTLDVNATTGEINLATATAGNHQVTYSIASDNVNCTSAGTYTATITITASTSSDVVFSYNPTCVIATSNPLPVVLATFATGGTFSSTTLSVNASTGEINLATATAGNHQVTYTLPNNVTTCIAGGTHTATTTINASTSPVTSFTYSSTFCSENTNETPTLSTGFTTGGIFTATNGLVINATNGEISITESSSGNYTITYSILADSSICRSAGIATFTIIVTNDFAINVEDSCENKSLVLNALPVNGSFDPSIANYVWSNSSNVTIGTNSATFDVDTYLSQNTSVTIPFTVNVSVEVNGCSSSTSYVILSDSCKQIPRGVSPNGDGDNDTFDLDGLNVKELIIFNRYGARVYSFEGNYTNQWHGQTDKGDLLPDATYFYSIIKEGGKAVSGWVYVNK